MQIATIKLPNAPDFEVPQVQLANAAAAQRLNQTLTRLMLTAGLSDTTRAPTAAAAIRRAVAEYKAANKEGLTGTSYDILFNRAGLLSLALTTEYMGAYPSTTSRHATFDIRTGRCITLPELLADTILLRQQWHQRLTQRVAAHVQRITRDYPGDSDTWATVWEQTGWDEGRQQVSPAALPALREFALTPKGLVLYSSFEFPHAVLALAPADDYLFAYADLEPRQLLRQAVTGSPPQRRDTR
ncbi:hypothetical protein [Hymenobacter baengnokdamensis]|uniref:hypothetical protein n=1 Tax=Hymenobacter baengnokdamensis TaxID=2615203 RepID=UPI0012483211|nr:hypothetical protein [Hymenobacter baengnokdamensis]